MKLDLEQIKADREARDDQNIHVNEQYSAHRRSMLRVPELENVAVEAMVAMEAIVARSHDDPLGTSKVIDMRKIAEAFLARFQCAQQTPP